MVVSGKNYYKNSQGGHAPLILLSEQNLFDSNFSGAAEIANYFIDRQTSGFVEGLNNKIKVIKRRCYGILNVKHLFQRIHLDLSGYALFA